MPLLLTRREGEAITITTTESEAITITAIAVRRGAVRIAIDAPASMRISRPAPPAAPPVGARIRSAIALTGMSQRAWCAQSGWCRSQIQEITSGRVSPSVATLTRIAASLGVPAAELL